MKKHFLFFAMALGLMALVSGCKTELDMQNLDTRSELDFGLAIPLGTVRATVGDFLGNGQVKGIYVGSNNVFYFKDTFKITRTFHDVDLKSKISDTDKHFNVDDELESQGKLDPDGTVNETGTQIKMEFPFKLQLTNINNDVFDERLDSGLIDNATFTSTIGRRALPLDAAWVDKVEIELGSEFRRNAGKTITICKKGEFSYDKNIPITVDQFVLDLMKNHNPASYQEYPYNVKDECNMQINFYFTIPKGEKVVIPTNARYNYHLQVEFVKFTALWGFFKPSADMRDADTVNIEDEWPKWHDLAKARLPFSEPKVDLYVKTQVAGAMVLNGDYLYAMSNKTGEKVYTTYDQNMTDYHRTYPFLAATSRDADGYQVSGYLPLNSQIGDSAKGVIPFDNSWQNGHIERLFVIRPDMLGYKFDITFDASKTPQVRVLPNTDVKIEADLEAPFRFNKGLEASYVDTLKDIKISNLSLDSLAASSEMIDTIKTAQLKLVLAFENKLPVRVKARVRFMDENGKTVMDPDDPTKPLMLAQSDTLLIDAPEVKFEQGRSYIGEPGKNIFTIDVDKEHYETFTTISSMEYFVELDTEQMNSAYDRDPEYKIQITTEDNLKIHLGISAIADLIFNFNSNNNQK